MNHSSENEGRGPIYTLLTMARPRPFLEAAITLVLLMATTGIGLLFMRLGFSEANIITVFILCVLVISVMTVSPAYSVVGSLASVLLFNWFFTDPIFSFHTYEAEYAVTFAIMLLSSLITGTLANRIKQNARRSAREAYRTKVLLDTNLLLQKADNAEDVVRVTANQVTMLLNREVVIYPGRNGTDVDCDSGRVKTAGTKETDVVGANVDGTGTKETGVVGANVDGTGTKETDAVGANEGGSPLVARGGEVDSTEAEIVRWVFENQKPAGPQTEAYKMAKSLYHPICLNGYGYGVIVIRLNGMPMEPFENSIVTSILGECALALENLRNAAEKEKASVIARNEQLRSNLLRSVSHDIRTPLTSISGNASNLLSHYRQLDDEMLQQIFTDIYDDAEWLIDLVENLLSISRMENGQMRLNLSTDVVNEVIEEAIKHVDRNAANHHVHVANNDEILLIRVDVRLIMQVLINLVNNAIKNTQPGSEILIDYGRKEDAVVISVTDNGPGISDEAKPRIFEMFYTGDKRVADGRRGLGIGLALCKSIVEAHGGKIELQDNEPTGCRFSFSLPIEEIPISE